MYRVFILLFLVYVTQAQIPSFGFCPDYLPMPHFDMNRFLGKWYEAERYFQFSEVASRCVVTDYAVGPNGKIYVSNEVTNRFTGVKRVIGGNLDLTGKRTEGRLVVKYDTQPISTTSALTILDTDYDNYAVIWSCSGLGPVNAQSAWLMTRERIPDTIALQQAYGVLDRYKISRTFFVKTDQEGCAIAASDLNAALGIASTSTNVEQNAEVDTGKKESVGAKAQTVPEVLFKRAEEEAAKEENSAALCTTELSKPVDELPKLSAEDNNPLEKTDAEKVPESELVNNTEESNEDLALRLLPSIPDTIPDKDISKESDFNIENNSEERKKDCTETTTAINEENGENTL